MRPFYEIIAEMFACTHTTARRVSKKLNAQLEQEKLAKQREEVALHNEIIEQKRRQKLQRRREKKMKGAW